ncbi:MAG: hypothetical protein KTQ49_01750 [Candidatus Omnitrophica bacterium]|nr:hypothetical protein [Candidatus Omnitrophota bacterium]
MRFSLKIFFISVAVLFLAVFVLATVMLGRVARSDEFKRFAEQKVGEYLKAKVHIGVIRPYGFNQIALEKIMIEGAGSEDRSQLIRVERLLFRYRLDQFWSRHFELPSAVVLNNPSVVIEPDRFPYRYLEPGSQKGAGFPVPSLDFKGGEIRYLLPSLGKEVRLTEVVGKITPTLDQQVFVDVRAKATGLLEGSVAIRGHIQPFRNIHDLWLELETMDFSQDIPVPFRGIKGKVHWVGSDLFFEGLQATLHGWQASIDGSFLNREGQPEVSCRVQIGKEKPWVRLNFLLNFFRQHLEGDFWLAGELPLRFDGKVRQDGKRFFLDSMRVDRGYQASGELDFATGNYDLVFEKGDAKRAEVQSNLRGLDFSISFRFDHFQVLDLDVVTRGKLFLHAVSSHWNDRSFMFKGALETDYFILERQPFDDLKGVFDLSPYGISGIDLSWGGKFQLTGQVVLPAKRPQGKLTVRVDDFDLGLVQEFNSKPLPKELGGLLNGKLVIDGELSNPEVQGVFNVRDGKWGRLQYDRGIIQLRGTPPYLPLRDSKIWKGRTTFYLNGALDLKLDNIFAGVKIETPDNLVIWKGLEAVAHSRDGSVQVNPSKLGTWGEVSILEAETDTSETRKGPGHEEEVTAVKVGPKLKF